MKLLSKKTRQNILNNSKRNKRTRNNIERQVANMFLTAGGSKKKIQKGSLRLKYPNMDEGAPFHPVWGKEFSQKGGSIEAGGRSNSNNNMSNKSLFENQNNNIFKFENNIPIKPKTNNNIFKNNNNILKKQKNDLFNFNTGSFKGKVINKISTPAKKNNLFKNNNRRFAYGDHYLDRVCRLMFYCQKNKESKILKNLPNDIIKNILSLNL